MALRLFKSFADSFVMGGKQTLIAADQGLNGNRLRCRKGQIVQGPPLTLFVSIHTHAVRTVARS